MNEFCTVFCDQGKVDFNPIVPGLQEDFERYDRRSKALKLKKDSFMK